MIYSNLLTHYREGTRRKENTFLCLLFEIMKYIKKSRDCIIIKVINTGTPQQLRIKMTGLQYLYVYYNSAQLFLIVTLKFKRYHVPNVTTKKKINKHTHFYLTSFTYLHLNSSSSLFLYKLDYKINFFFSKIDVILF